MALKVPKVVFSRDTLLSNWRVLGKWSWCLKANGIRTLRALRNTHYERVAWPVFRQARHLDYKGLSEKAQAAAISNFRRFLLQ
jgi:hypothetical protein